MQKIEIQKTILLTALILLIFVSGCVTESSNQDLNSQDTKNKNINSQNNVEPLSVVEINLPTWISEEFNLVDLTTFIKGGIYDYHCKLSPDSVLPQGLELETDSCVISGTIILAPGSTKSISPPFTIIMTDGSNPVQTVSLKLSITTLEKGPTITSNYDVTCNVDTDCSNVQLATADGGTPPYTFYLGSNANPTPIGTSVGVNGYLEGTPTTEGSFSSYICVKDIIGATDCEYVYITVYGKGVIPEKKSSDFGFQKYVLTVVSQGPGKVTSDDNKIDCGTKCTAEYSMFSNLTAKPSENSFVGKLEGCNPGYNSSTTDNVTCSIAMNSVTTVNAQFYPNPNITTDSFDCKFVKSDYAGTQLVYKSTTIGKVSADADDTCFIPIISASTSDETVSFDCGDWTKEKDEYNKNMCVKKPGQPSETIWKIVKTHYWTEQYFYDGAVKSYMTISKGKCTDGPDWLYQKKVEYTSTENCPEQ